MLGGREGGGGILKEGEMRGRKCGARLRRLQEAECPLLCSYLLVKGQRRDQGLLHREVFPTEITPPIYVIAFEEEV